MKLSHIALVALLGTSVALPGYAQPGPGPGRGPASERPRFRFNQDNTFGWKLMSAQERAAHRDKMLAAKTYAECKAAQDEQHQLMQARAKEKHMTLPTPRHNVCDRMKARGLLQ
jgi:hypothetical protein